MITSKKFRTPSNGKATMKADYQVIFKKKHVGVQDLTMLSTLSNDAIYRTLEERFKAGEIYTYIGYVLISVNPFRDLGLYVDQVLNSYIGKSPLEMPPHVFALAEAAYKNLKSFGVSQSVIITGESGAGKTEVAKLMLRYLSTISGSTQEKIKTTALASSVILESFGNAKTLRNDNSSRFGKYMEIVFNSCSEIQGSYTTNYLLEKSRVVHQNCGERNFHIFYQMLLGSNDTEKSNFCLYTPQDFFYTSQGNTFDINGVDDANNFLEVKRAFSSLGISNNEVQDIIQILSAILWLGNVDFYENENCAQINSHEVVEMVSYLLSIDSLSLTYALTHRYVETGRGSDRRGTTYHVPLNLVQAKAARDSLSKSIYDHLFDYIVQRINKESGVYDPNALYIGILDIYGFEIFEKNYFEQLCINFVNEKLQQIFVELTLKTEQAEYLDENISWTPIKYFDNQIVCNLIEERRPPGIFSVLNDVIATSHADSDGADRSLVQRLGSCSNNPHFQARSNAFCVRHYAGDVVYETKGMPEKNKDTINKDLKQLILSSENNFFTSLFPDYKVTEESKKVPSCSEKIKISANSLADRLRKTNPSYVRCLKPNQVKSPYEFDNAMVMHQIKYLGLLENVRLRRAGFCYRKEFKEFVHHFFLLSRATCYAGEIILKGNSDTEYRNACVSILKDCFIDKSEWQLGRTKLFIRRPEILFILENLKERYFHHMSQKIQRLFKNYIRRKAVAASIIQKYWKLHQAKNALLAFRDSGHSVYSMRKERRRYSLLSSRRFLGDYLLIRNFNSDPVIFSMTGNTLEERILLGSKIVPRVIILTTRNLYILKGAIDKIETEIDINEITGISTSPWCDDWVVLLCSSGSGDVSLNCLFKTEFIVNLVNFSKKHIPVYVNEEILYQTKGKKKSSLKFIMDPKLNFEQSVLRGNTIRTGMGERPNSVSKILKMNSKIQKVDNFSQKNCPETYRALYGYEAQRFDELNMRAGEVFELIEVDDLWIKAKRPGDTKEGWIPLNYLEKLEALNKEAPPLPPQKPSNIHLDLPSPKVVNKGFPLKSIAGDKLNSAPWKATSPKSPLKLKCFPPNLDSNPPPSPPPSTPPPSSPPPLPPNMLPPPVPANKPNLRVVTGPPSGLPSPTITRRPTMVKTPFSPRDFSSPPPDRPPPKIPTIKSPTKPGFVSSRSNLQDKINQVNLNSAFGHK